MKRLRWQYALMKWAYIATCCTLLSDNYALTLNGVVQSEWQRIKRVANIAKQNKNEGLTKKATRFTMLLMSTYHCVPKFALFIMMLMRAQIRMNLNALMHTSAPTHANELALVGYVIFTFRKRISIKERMRSAIAMIIDMRLVAASILGLMPQLHKTHITAYANAVHGIL